MRKTCVLQVAGGIGRGEEERADIYNTHLQVKKLIDVLFHPFRGRKVALAVASLSNIQRHSLHLFTWEIRASEQARRSCTAALPVI
jgi:hypothetical protein